MGRMLLVFVCALLVAALACGSSTDSLPPLGNIRNAAGCFNGRALDGAATGDCENDTSDQ